MLTPIQGRHETEPREGEPSDDSGLRPTRRWRILLAHDATAVTCDPLVDAIEGGLGNVDINESSSGDDARLALRTSRFDLCLVCLDLPPVPTGGARLAQDMVALGLPVVLITRSQRWIPPFASALRELPWVAPDASPAEVARAALDAVAALGGRPDPRSRDRGCAPESGRSESRSVPPGFRGDVTWDDETPVAASR